MSDPDDIRILGIVKEVPDGTAVLAVTHQETPGYEPIVILTVQDPTLGSSAIALGGKQLLELRELVDSSLAMLVPS